MTLLLALAANAAYGAGIVWFLYGQTRTRIRVPKVLTTVAVNGPDIRGLF